MPLADAVGRIRGVMGTPVTLGVSRPGWNAPRAFTLTREALKEGAPAPAQAPPKSVDEEIEGILKGM
jgi:C-terminal processing protease CtpA/Prc